MNAKWLENLLLKSRSWCIVYILQTEPTNNRLKSKTLGGWTPMILEGNPWNVSRMNKETKLARSQHVTRIQTLGCQLVVPKYLPGYTGSVGSGPISLCQHTFDLKKGRRKKGGGWLGDPHLLVTAQSVPNTVPQIGFQHVETWWQKNVKTTHARRWVGRIWGINGQKCKLIISSVSKSTHFYRYVWWVFGYSLFVWGTFYRCR